MKRSQKKILNFMLAVLAVVAAVFLIYIWQDRLKGSNGKPTIICPSESLYVSVETLNDRGVLLKDMTALDVEDGDITDYLVVESISQFVEPGHCIVTYAAFDSDNNVSKLTRHLFLTDYTSPRFRLTGPLDFNYSSSFNPLNCVEAYDCVDGDISDRVKMALVNPNDEITAMGAHLVEFRVTNSLGDVSVLEAEIDVYDRTYTEARNIPTVKLSDYLIYIERFGWFDPAGYVSGITLGGVTCSVEEYGAGKLEIDRTGVDLSTPGVYKVVYKCDNRGDYVGYAVLMVVVTEVNG
ncbi:MAG: hypothetical protein K6G56_04035 [Clostridiales bacterium]|nr:hypothetical protein [Clostridiales bacterium]